MTLNHQNIPEQNKESWRQNNIAAQTHCKGRTQSSAVGWRMQNNSHIMMANLFPTTITNQKKIYVRKQVSSIKDASKTGYPHAEE